MLTLFLSSVAAKKNKEGWGAMQYPQLILGMFAIFAYVGTEATIQSNMGALLKTPEYGGISESALAPYISLYWGSLMIGRWTGAIGAFKLSNTAKYLLLIVVPLVAFGVVLGVNYLSGVDMSKFYPYVFFIFILIIAFFIGQQRPVRTLVVFGLLGITAMIVGLCTIGHFSTLVLISGGLCCSIMWPSIFSLSITGLGKYTAQGSAFLIMMILGGAIIPPIQGFVADSSNNAIGHMSGIHFSYIVPALGFTYLAWFAWKVSKELKTQGIDLDQVAVSNAKH
jgi:FHS family L-fucose permease-like MFS transporter